MVNKKEQNEVLSTICDLFGINLNEIKINDINKVSEDADGNKTYTVDISSPDGDGKGNLEEIKKNLQEKLDSASKNLKNDFQTKTLNVSGVIGEFLSELGKGIIEEVEKRKSENESKKEEDNGCHCDKCENCQNCDNHKESLTEENADSQKASETTPYSAEEIRKMLKSRQNERLYLEDFSMKVSDFVEAFVEFCFDSEEYDAISEDLDGDEAGIYMIMTAGELTSIINDAKEELGFSDETTLRLSQNEIRDFILGGVETSALDRAFDAFDVELIDSIDTISQEDSKDTPLVKISFWF